MPRRVPRHRSSEKYSPTIRRCRASGSDGSTQSSPIQRPSARTIAGGATVDVEHVRQVVDLADDGVGDLLEDRQEADEELVLDHPHRELVDAASRRASSHDHLVVGGRGTASRARA